VNWGEEENLRLVSAWLKYSNDPIQGVDRRGDRYRKDVAAEYNLHAPKEQRRTSAKLKNHWNKTIPLIPSSMDVMTRQGESMLVANLMTKSWKEPVKSKKKLLIKRGLLHWSIGGEQ
jgi:hypothetical protein